MTSRTLGRVESARAYTLRLEGMVRDGIAHVVRTIVNSDVNLYPALAAEAECATTPMLAGERRCQSQMVSRSPRHRRWRIRMCWSASADGVGAGDTSLRVQSSDLRSFRSW